MATPIGNLRDITLRALDVLASADLVACEDSRVTRRLLDTYGLSPRLLSYHEHNATEMRPKLVKAVLDGKVVALVSDAGTPLVSDPGYKLVGEMVLQGLPVVSVPGPSAALTALVASGLPTDRFFFAGFLSPKAAARRQEIAELAPVPATLILYEGAPRLPELLADLAAMLGVRAAAVARELTKVYEELRRGTLAELADHYAREGAPKGEIVVLVAPPGQAVAEVDVDALLRVELKTRTLRDAAAVVAARSGLPRREVYARAVALRSQDA